MKRHFEIVEAYKGIIDESFLPRRSDDGSAGYDLRVAVDVVIPSILKLRQDTFHKALKETEENEDSLEYDMFENGYIPTLDEAEALTKKYGIRATYVPTGLKAKFPKNETLDVVDRSSIGTKLLISLPHAVGIVDSSYYNNEDNEGHIAQAIFRPYEITSNDEPIKDKRTGGVGSTGR